LSVTALDGTNGSRLQGWQYAEQAGWSLCTAADLNNDGIKDIIIGAQRGTAGGFPQPGHVG
jgi:hypothetical protein